MKSKHIIIAFILLGIMSLMSCSNRGYMQNGCPKGYSHESKQGRKHWKEIKASIRVKIPGQPDYCTTVTRMK